MEEGVMSFGRIEGPVDTPVDLYRIMYENGQTTEYSSTEVQPKSEYKNAIEFYVRKNMIGKIACDNDPECSGKDQQCFDALGRVSAIAKASFPDSGIYEIAEETFGNMIKNYKKFFALCEEEGSESKVRPHAYNENLALLESEFNTLVNDGAEKILKIVKKLK